MRTPAEQLEQVRHRLLSTVPEFVELRRRTGIADGILFDMVQHFKDADAGPYITILLLWERWKQHCETGSSYYTFVHFVAVHEERMRTKP